MNHEQFHSTGGGVPPEPSQPSGRLDELQRRADQLADIARDALQRVQQTDVEQQLRDLRNTGGQ